MVPARRHAPALTPFSLRSRAYEAVRPSVKVVGERGRRALNILVASIGIVVTAPVMLAIALLVKATSRGPVVYRQPRVGMDRRGDRSRLGRGHRRKADAGGQLFTIYKFRTMTVAGDDDPQVWASSNDSRITVVGRVLRAVRLDELPQLFNVLKGDMNIVGPRPEQPQIFADLSGEVRQYRSRQKVLPGITGLAQISLPYDSCVEDVKTKVSLDLEYIQRRSVAQDLIIMAKTMPVMVMGKGAR